jgi:hypothetical protein
MSARLIGIMDGVQQHNFQDDLESSIYVLLWMTLMYSSCSDMFHVPHFLSHVLDPQPRGRDGLGSLGKADFLQARTFLKLVNFPGRPSLHKLIFQLAQLFSVRYEANDANLANGITVMPIQFSHAYEALIMMDYKFREEALSTHDYTINLFDQALLSCSTWPSDDSAVKQDFQSDLASPRSQVLKTGWDTMCVVYESNKEVIDLADVDTRSSDSEQSDRMTEGSDFFDDNSF